MNPLKVALVYDRVNTPHGGAEQLLLALHELFPEAPLYTSVYSSRDAAWASVFSVRTSFLQHIPFAKYAHRLFLAFMPLAFESFCFDEFDVVISVSSGEAKGVLTKPSQLHICYLLTPTRYLWSHREAYQHNWLTGWLRKIIFTYVRWWDESAAFRPDVFLPISDLVAARCAKYYHRIPGETIYPTVGLSPSLDQRYSDNELLPEIAAVKNEYYLIVSRLVPYKKIDLAIEACQLAGKHLIIIGQGPDIWRLKWLAKRQNRTAKIFFLQAVQADRLGAYYHYSRAFLSLAEEDFGITTLEAQRHGKPVVVFEKSGGAEIVEDGVTGLHIATQDVSDVVEAMHILEHLSWDSQTIQKHAQHLTQHAFQHKFSQAIAQEWKKHAKGSYVT